MRACGQAPLLEAFALRVEAGDLVSVHDGDVDRAIGRGRRVAGELRRRHRPFAHTCPRRPGSRRAAPCSWSHRPVAAALATQARKGDNSACDAIRHSHGAILEGESGGVLSYQCRDLTEKIARDRSRRVPPYASCRGTRGDARSARLDAAGMPGTHQRSREAHRERDKTFNLDPRRLERFLRLRDQHPRQLAGVDRA